MSSREPGGFSDIEIRMTLVQLRAFGEIMAVAPAVLDGIVDKARLELETKPGRTPPVVTPPTPPPPPPP